MKLEKSIFLIKEIRIHRKYIDSTQDFIDTLSKGGVEASKSFRFVTIPISKIEKMKQTDLDWIFATVYARCKLFSIIIDSR